MAFFESILQPFRRLTLLGKSGNLACWAKRGRFTAILTSQNDRAIRHDFIIQAVAGLQIQQRTNLFGDRDRIGRRNNDGPFLQKITSFLLGIVFKFMIQLSRISLNSTGNMVFAHKKKHWLATRMHSNPS